MLPPDVVKDYLAKSGDKEIIAEGVHVYFPDKGFLIYSVKDSSLVLLQGYGDGKFWDKYSEILAKKLGLKSIKLGTKRNPKTFERKFGYKVVGYILEKEVK